MTDDAHGIGVVGGGRGSTFAWTAKADVPLQMGTLSKAIGGYGGYLCASAAVIELIRNRARTFVYSTGLPPALAAAAIAALDLIEREPDYRRLAAPQGESLRSPRSGCRSRKARSCPRDRRGRGGAGGVALAGEPKASLVTAIRPPTVPAGTARLRFTFTAEHPDDEIERLAEHRAQR